MPVIRPPIFQIPVKTVAPSKPLLKVHKKKITLGDVVKASKVSE